MQYRAIVKDTDVVRFTRRDLEKLLEELRKSGADEIGVAIEPVQNHTTRPIEAYEDYSESDCDCDDCMGY